MFSHTSPFFGSNLLLDYIVISQCSSFYNRSVSRYTNFNVLLTVHLSTTLVNDQLDAQLLYFIIRLLVLYMFRATSCSSSGGPIVPIQHLVQSLSESGRSVCRSRGNSRTCIPEGHLQRVTIADAVLVQFGLLMMSTTLLETSSGL